MRKSILAGLILGLSLAIQSMVVAHSKVVHPPSAVRVHVKVVAPWYIAASDSGSALVQAELRPRCEKFGA
jgi:hypothetical protein